MARTLLLVATTLALAAGVLGHARLLSPLPWNRGFTKTRPCGGSSKLPPSATFVRNQVNTLQWQVIASDGLGPVTLTLDRFGSANPPGSASTTIISLPATTENRIYTLNFTLPADFTCPNSGCTLQVASAGWFSCATFNDTSVVADAASRSLSTCTVAQNLDFCSMMNGQEIRIAQGASVAQLDAQAQDAYNFNLGSSAVFANPQSDDCRRLYKEYVCYDTFPLCTATQGVCRDACVSMTNACVLKAQHAGLYDCTKSPTSSCTDATTMFYCCTAGQGFGIFLLVVLLVSIVAFVGMMVYWKSANPSKYNSVMAKPGEWWSSLRSRF